MAKDGYDKYITPGRRVILPWFICFLSLKASAIGGFTAWSWWWLLLPAVPVIVELGRVVFER